MAGNNTNIVHVNAVQGLVSEIIKHLKELEPNVNLSHSCVDQTIAKENAEEWIRHFQVEDVHKLQQVFE